MTNVELARFNMVEQQVRPWDVLDSQVLDLMEAMPREAFVPDAYKNVAYADIDIPIGHDEVMLAPKYVGRMLQALNIHEGDVALEVGCGTGYVTALLGQVCREVYSVDIHQDFVDTAAANLKAQGIENVTLETGDAAQGWDAHRPYDVIFISGSTPELPESFQKSLNRGGRMVAIIGDGPVMEATLITRTGSNEWRKEMLFETEIKPLVNAAKPQRFVF
jgi:protein-L-isoaspartate(D-aspartate) O-methyltransferase